MTTEEKIAVMQAEVDGKKIELKNKKCEVWAGTDQPLTWDWWSYDYRVAKEPRVFYYNEYKDGLGNKCSTAEEAIKKQVPGVIRIVRFVEDMEYRNKEE